MYARGGGVGEGMEGVVEGGTKGEGFVVFVKKEELGWFILVI